MNSAQLTIYLDQNDAEWTSQRYYIDCLIKEYCRTERVNLTENIDQADIIHLNYLNPLGRIVHGKVDRWKHLRDVAKVYAGSDTPVVATSHGVEEFSDVGESMYIKANPTLRRLADGTKRLASRTFARNIDAVIAISSMDRGSLIAAGFSSENVYHVSHGVNEVFLNSPDYEDDDFILHVSKCSPHKNPDAIIEVGERLETPLKIVGGGWKENYGSELKEIEDVELLGYVPQERLVELYCSALALYFPSIYEPFGLPILESMACGTPVVASVNSAAPDICEECITLIDPGEIDQHLDALRRLVDDDRLRAGRGRQAKESAKSFTWLHTAKQTADIYERLVAT